MKKYIFLVLALILFSLTIFSQQKKKIRPEIDRLADKYKNDSVLTIYSYGNELNCNVSVVYNSDKKPEEVFINGNDKNKNLVAEVLANLVVQKIKLGYKACDYESSLATDKRYVADNLLNSNNVINSINVSYKYKMGNMIFKIEGGKEECTSDFIFYWFIISTIDNRRVGGHKATKLDI